MVVLEAVGRLVPGVMGNAGSAEDESFSDGLLEYPQYTRPARSSPLRVGPRSAGPPAPEVLLSGDHGRIARWRRAQCLCARTAAPGPTCGRAARAGLPSAAEAAVLLRRNSTSGRAGVGGGISRPADGPGRSRCTDSPR